MTAERKKHYQNKDLGSSSTMPSKMHINQYFLQGAKRTAIFLFL